MLFIEEAYSRCTRDNDRDFGQNVIEILLQVMENNRDDLVVFMAGHADRKDRCGQPRVQVADPVSHRVS